MSVKFIEYNWDKSSYVNFRDKVKRDDFADIKKVNVWNKYATAASFQFDAWIDTIDASPGSSVNDSGAFTTQPALVMKANDYFLATSSLGLVTDTPIMHTNEDGDECPTADQLIEYGATYLAGTLWSTNSTDSSKLKSLNRLPLLQFIRTYQIANDIGLYSQTTQDNVSIEDSLSTLLWFKNLVVDNLSAGIIVKPYSRKHFLDNSITSSFITSNILHPYIYTTYIDKIAAQAQFLGDKVSHISVRTTSVVDPFGYTYDKLTSRVEMGGVVKLDNQVYVTADLFGTSDNAIEALKLQAVLQLIYDTTEKNGLLTEISGSNGYRSINIDRDSMLFILDTYLIPHAQSLADDFDSIVIAARDTPLGKILFSFSALEDLLNTDVSTYSDMSLSFRIQNYNNITAWNQADEAMTPTEFNLLEEKFPEWKNYAFAVLSSKGNLTGSYRCPAYIWDWEKLLKAKKDKLVYALQSTLAVDVTVPTPKHSIGWFNVLIAVVSLVLIFIPGSQALGALGVTAAFAAGVAAVATIAFELTGNKGLAELAKITGYVGLVAGMLNTLTSGIKNIVKTSIDFALTLANQGINYIFKKKLEKKQDTAEALNDTIDGVNELIGNEAAKKDDIIREYIWGGNMEMKYDIAYTYDYDYNTRK